jgi:hypothetical protein
MRTLCKREHEYDADRHSVCPICYSAFVCTNCDQPLILNSCPRCSLSFSFQIVQDRERALEVPNLSIPIGSAPDGLPWILTIRRGSNHDQGFSAVIESVKDEVKNVLKNKIHLLRVHNPEGIARATDDFVSRVGKEISELQVRHVATGDGSRVRCFVSSQAVQSVARSTFFDQLLSPRGVTIPVYSDGNSRGSRAEITAAAMSAESNKEVLSRFRLIEEEMKYNKHLLLELEGKGASVARVKAKDFSNITFLRGFTYESLFGLKEIEAIVEYPGEVASRAVNLRDHDDYLKETKRAKNRGGQIRYSFARQCLGELMVGLARGLNELHTAGKVHCDLKPQNVLLTESGLEAFDGMEVAAGEISLAHTLEWASPEQVSGKPVGPSSDVYSLALMWLRCLRGTLYGEETTFLLPVFGEPFISQHSEGPGGIQVQAVKILKDPLAYVPAGEGQSVEWQAAWQAFFRGCFTFDPDKRVRDGNSFAGVLEEMLNDYPIPGMAKILPYWGSLSYFCFEAPNLSLGWDTLD